MTSRRFLMVSDLAHDELASVLRDAAAMKLDRLQHRSALEGQSVGIFFEHPSTRTRISSEVAVAELGAHPVTLRGEEVGIGSREAPEDVARVLSRYVSLIGMRVRSHETLEAIAEAASVPVVNLLSDRSHPCQALADLQTIAEHRPLPGTRLAYVGDGNNVAHSLLIAGAMSGMEVVVATPEGYEPSGEIVAEARSLAAKHEGAIHITSDAEAAVSGADVVYTDVWTSMGQEAESAERAATFEAFAVSEQLFAMAAPTAVFLHCLPAHRGEEVTAAMMEHPRSLVYDQAENRLHAFKALVLHLLGSS